MGGYPLGAPDLCTALAGMNITPFIVALLAIGLYWPAHLCGFVFDDSFAITGNADTTDAVPLLDVFGHDFWGTATASPTAPASYQLVLR